MLVNLDLFKPLLEQKLITVQGHPEDNLLIFNYTPKAQFLGKAVWTPELKMCRGLITDKGGTVKARPFDKFFNYSEHSPEELPQCPFQAFDKLDGSLGILYQRDNGEYAIATRGSFTSEQALEGTKMLHEMLEQQPSYAIDPQWTQLFEIIYPENRIVVNYGQVRELAHIASRNIETGEIRPSGWLIEDYSKPRENAEGVVLYFDNGFMCKVKYDEYVRLHRLITGVNAHTIWDLLRNHQSFDELLDRVPDEFYSFVKQTKKDLEEEYSKWLTISLKVYEAALTLPDRKKQAIWIKQFNCQSIVFAMLDGKPYEDIIWKRIRPQAERPFRKDE